MVKITGREAFKSRMRAMRGPEMVRQIGAALYAGGSIIADDMALSITEGSVSGKGHVPSKPGEPPNADTNLLDRSIETVQVAPLKVEVSANAPYAADLEFGTSKMAERPYARPAVARKRGEAVELVQRAVNKVIAGGRVVP